VSSCRPPDQAPGGRIRSASTTFRPACGKVVDGGPAPDMTVGAPPKRHSFGRLVLSTASGRRAVRHPTPAANIPAFTRCTVLTPTPEPWPSSASRPHPSGGYVWRPPSWCPPSADRVACIRPAPGSTSQVARGDRRCDAIAWAIVNYEVLPLQIVRAPKSCNKPVIARGDAAN
jgi:hypothetical protein